MELRQALSVLSIFLLLHSVMVDGIEIKIGRARQTPRTLLQVKEASESDSLTEFQMLGGSAKNVLNIHYQALS